MRRTLALLVLALLGWGLCGAIIGVGRTFLSMETTLLVHAAGAPLIAGSLAFLYGRFHSTPSSLAVATVFLGVVVVMDAGLVAPFLERSYDMFRSPIGTWIPFALIFAAAWRGSRWARSGRQGYR